VVGSAPICLCWSLLLLPGSSYPMSQPGPEHASEQGATPANGPGPLPVPRSPPTPSSTIAAQQGTRQSNLQAQGWADNKTAPRTAPRDPDASCLCTPATFSRGAHIQRGGLANPSFVFFWEFVFFSHAVRSFIQKQRDILRLISCLGQKKHLSK
jgi:hypothetical protein